MASGVVTLVSVTTVSANVYNIVTLAPGATGIAVNDHLAANLFGGLSTTGGVWRVNAVTDAQHFQVTDDRKTSGTYGSPAIGKAQFYTPTANQNLSQSVDGGPYWSELDRRDNKLVDTKLTDANTRLTTLESNPSIRIFALESTLLSTDLSDGHIAYAQNTDKFWLRVSGSWDELVEFSSDQRDALADILTIEQDDVEVADGIKTINFSDDFIATVDGDDSTKLNIDLDLLSDDTPETLVVDEAADSGSSTEASRSDHKHALASAGLGTITSVGTSKSAGSSPTVALGDHRHDLPLSTLLAVLAAGTSTIIVNGQRITGLATPSASTDAATKAYVDASAGGNWKAAVKAATTANVTLSGAQTIDGISLIAGDRILVKNQSSGAENGIYVVASGSWSRATDVDTANEITSMMVLVQQGTANANTSWLLTTQSITLGTTALTYVRFNGLGQVTAGNGLSKSNDTLAVAANVDGSIVADGSGVRVGVLAGDAQHGNLGNGALHTNATTSTAGFMSASDKTKLNGITTSAAAVTAAAPQDVTKSAAAVGVATTAARADHKHDVTTDAPGAVAIGDSASEGSSTALARADHVHSLAAPSAPVDVTKASASAGSSPDAARADHKHDISTAAPSTTLSPATTNSEGTATSVARSDHTHAVSTSSSAQNVGTSNAAGSANTYSRGDHAHALPFSTVQTVLAGASGDIAVNNQKITGLATPASGTDAATKAYVDAAAAGIDWKGSVRAATTANIALSGAQTIDGVSVIAGDRVLVKVQTAGEQNGIYVAAVGAWSRATDADVSAEVTAGLAVFVEEGTTNADTGWLLTTNGAITLGVTSLTFTQFTGIGSLTAGAGLTKSGNTVNVVANGDGSIVVNSDDIQVGTLASDDQHGELGGGDLHEDATQSTAGFMSAADKTAFDNLLPSEDEKDALGGTDGSPSSSNKFVTDSDDRLSDARTPTSHTASHKHGGSDEIATATAGANVIPKANGSGKLDIGFIPTGTSSTTVVVGNDSRVPTQGENDALGGTDGTPSTSNKYVTDSDARNTNSRTPTSHAASHKHSGSDEIATVTPGSFAIPKAGNDGKIAVGFVPVGTSSGTVAAGDDARIPTSSQKSALAGSNGTPSGANPYVTDSDSRNTNSRAPTGSAGGDLGGTYPNPTVLALHELGGNKLTLGAVAQHQFLRREGSTLVGYDTTFADHGSTHLGDGSDAIPDATNDVSGLLPGPFFHKLTNMVDLVADYGMESDADDPNPANWTDNTVILRDAIRDFDDAQSKYLYLPKGFYGVQDLPVTRTTRIVGETGPINPATILKAYPGKHGLIIHSNESALDSTSGEGTRLSNLCIDGNATAALSWTVNTTKAVGNYVVPTLANRNHFVYRCTAISTGLTHGSVEPTWPTTVGATVVDAGVTWTCAWGVGLLMYAPAFLDNVQVTGFDCDNVYIKGDEGGDPFTSVHGWSFENFVSSYSSQSGLYVVGPDSRAGKILGGRLLNNEMHGVWDASTYGNRYDNVFTKDNGLSPIKTAGASNRSSLIDCTTHTDEDPLELSSKTVIVGGSIESGFDNDSQQRIYDGEWHAPLLSFLSGSDELTFDEIEDGQYLMRDGDVIVGADLEVGDMNWINVMDYGADPTGTADSWQAFTDAMNAIPIGSQKYGILIPAGLYTLSKTWLLSRLVRIVGAGPRAAAARGTQLQGRKGFCVMRAQYTNNVIPGGCAGSILDGVVVAHQSGTGSWGPGIAGYLANQSAVIPTTGYNGHPDNYVTGSGEEPYVLRCVKDGTSGGSEPNWDAHGFGIFIEHDAMSRVSNTVTVTTLTAHGKTTGNTVYIRSEDVNFASGYYVITVVDSDTFTYTEVGANAVNKTPCYLADVIDDNTTAWIKVYIAGLRMDTAIRVQNCSFTTIGGDGVSVYATVGAATDGGQCNANGFKIEYCTASNTLGWGFVTRESDANAGSIRDCFAIQNGWGGFLENSNLGNKLDNVGCEANGLGRIAPSVGYGVVVPELPATNSSLIEGVYTEGGQKHIINARAMFIQTLAAGAYDALGTGTILGNLRCNTLTFINDTNNDNTGLGSSITIGRLSSQAVISYSFSQSGTSIGVGYGTINGSGFGATGWNSWGDSTTNFALSLDDSDEGEGHFWVPNLFFSGHPLVGGRVAVSTSTSAPVSGTWGTGDIILNSRPDNRGGVFAYKCMSGGTPGTWGAVLSDAHTTVNSDNAVVYAFYSRVAITGTVNQFYIDQPTGNYPDGVRCVIRDHAGNCGNNPTTVLVYNSGTINGDVAGYTIRRAFGSVTLVVRSGEWYIESTNSRTQGAPVAKATDVTLARADVGNLIHDTGSGALRTYTLPATASCQVGDYFDVYCRTANGIKLQANTNQVIHYLDQASTTAGSLQSNTQGSCLRIVYLASNYWACVQPGGQWETA